MRQVAHLEYEHEDQAEHHQLPEEHCVLAIGVAEVLVPAMQNEYFALFTDFVEQDTLQYIIIQFTNDHKYMPAVPGSPLECFHTRRFGQRVVHIVIVSAKLQVVKKESQLFRSERDHKRLEE